MFQMTPFKLAEFKYNLVKRGLQGKRDAFGSHYGAQSIRFLAMIGAAEMIARANDTSVLDAFLHLPFIQHSTELAMNIGKKVSGYDPDVEIDPKLAKSPPIELLYKTGTKGIGTAVSEHFQWWGTASKLYNIYHDQIPDTYDSWRKYLFGLYNPELMHGGKGRTGRKGRGGRGPRKAGTTTIVEGLFE